MAGETLVLSPHDPAAEDANTTWFGAPPHERIGLSAEEVVAAFEETAELLRDRVAESGHTGSATFYVWHDAQAGQLRCSVCTRAQTELPFGAEYRTTGNLHGIVREFIEDRASGLVVWGELEPNPYPAEASALVVWVYDLTPLE